MTALLITGTRSGVGTTVVTAALAALARSRGQRCTVLKPAQTGDGDDLATVLRLAGDDVGTVVLVRYPAPLPPAAAARAAGREPVDPAQCAHALLEAEREADLVLVDASGGLLLRYDEDGFTMADLARMLRLPVVVVVDTGDLNAVALTLEAAAHRGLDLTGLVIGSWPQAPGPRERSALGDLEMLAARPLLGALPPQLGARDRADFLATARAGLAPALGGTFDAAALRRTTRSGEP